MQISTNVIRFPVPPAQMSQRVESREAPAVEARETPSNVVDFPAKEQDTMLSARAQDYGLIFAAHRSVGRVADQLDQIPAL